MMINCWSRHHHRKILLLRLFRRACKIQTALKRWSLPSELNLKAFCWILTPIRILTHEQMNRKCRSEAKFRTICLVSNLRTHQVNKLSILVALSLAIHRLRHYVSNICKKKFHEFKHEIFDYLILVAPPPKAITPRRVNVMSGPQDLFGADPFEPITKPLNVSYFSYRIFLLNPSECKYIY